MDGELAALRDLFQGPPNLLAFPDFQSKPLRLQLSVLGVVLWRVCADTGWRVFVGVGPDRVSLANLQEGDALVASLWEPEPAQSHPSPTELGDKAWGWGHALQRYGEGHGQSTCPLLGCV